MNRTRIWGSVAALGGFWQISADSSGKREHWDGVWFGIARGAGHELVPAPGSRPSGLGLGRGEYPAAAHGARSVCKKPVTSDTDFAGSAVHRPCPDGLLASNERLLPPALVLANPPARFARVAKVVRYLINWSKACESHIDEIADERYRRHR